MGGDEQLARGIPAGLTRAEGRRFGLAVGGAFLALAALSGWRGHPAAALGAAVAAGALVIAGVAAPDRLGPVHRVWMRIALALSKVTTPVVLAFVYYLAFAPVGVVLRLLGRNPLARAGMRSQWISRGAARRSDLRRQF